MKRIWSPSWGPVWREPRGVFLTSHPWTHSDTQEIFRAFYKHSCTHITPELAVLTSQEQNHHPNVGESSMDFIQTNAFSGSSTRTRCHEGSGGGVGAGREADPVCLVLKCPCFNPPVSTMVTLIARPKLAGLFQTAQAFPRILLPTIPTRRTISWAALNNNG